MGVDQYAAARAAERAAWAAYTAAVEEDLRVSRGNLVPASKATLAAAATWRAAYRVRVAAGPPPRARQKVHFPPGREARLAA